MLLKIVCLLLVRPNIFELVACFDLKINIRKTMPDFFVSLLCVESQITCWKGVINCSPVFK
jgi:hypothetical protein